MARKPAGAGGPLPLPDILVAGGAFLTFIMSFMGWYKVTAAGITYGTGRGGPQTLVLILALLLWLFAGFILVNHFTNLVQLNLPLGLIYLAVGGLTELLVLLGIVWKPGGGGAGFFGVEVSLRYPIWIIALIFGAIPLAGAALKVQEA
jgi:hypothetical protein